MESLDHWVATLSGANVPVLRATIVALNQLRKREDTLTAREVSQVVLQDPLMTLRTLRFSQSRVTERQLAEITTVEHIIMMFGLKTFFKSCDDLVALEDTLGLYPVALRGVLGVMSRADHAAHYARAVAGLRFDVEVDEIVISALLHDLAELLMWSTAPTTMLQLEHMVTHTPGLRSAQAQRVALGFTLVELELALARAWNLPALFQKLLDDDHAEHPRVLSVTLSVALARHSAHGWYDPALPHDIAHIKKIVASQADQVDARLRWAAVQAARGWTHFGIRPALAWLPMLPGPWPEEEDRAPTDLGEINKDIVEQVVEQLLRSRPKDCTVHSVGAALCFALAKGLGLRRVWWGVLDPLHNRVKTGQMLQLDDGLLPSELEFPFPSKHLFGHLLQRQQGVWATAQSRPKLLPLLPKAMATRLAARDFFALALHAREQPRYLIYADGGVAGRVLDEVRYTLFKRVAMAAGRAMERTFPPQTKPHLAPTDASITAVAKTAQPVTAPTAQKLKA